MTERTTSGVARLRPDFTNAGIRSMRGSKPTTQGLPALRIDSTRRSAKSFMWIKAAARPSYYFAIRRAQACGTLCRYIQKSMKPFRGVDYLVWPRRRCLQPECRPARTARRTPVAAFTAGNHAGNGVGEARPDPKPVTLLRPP